MSRRRRVATGRRPAAAADAGARASWATAPTTSTGAARSCSRSAARRGGAPRRRAIAAERLLARATRLRPLLTYALPVTSVRIAGRDGPGLRRDRRPSRRGRGDAPGRATILQAAPGPRSARPRGETHMSAAARRAARRCRPLSSRVVPAARQPPHAAGDRRPDLPLPPHGEDALDLDLPKGRRVLPSRRDRTPAGDGPPRHLSASAPSAHRLRPQLAHELVEVVVVPERADAVAPGRRARSVS